MVRHTVMVTVNEFLAVETLPQTERSTGWGSGRFSGFSVTVSTTSVQDNDTPWCEAPSLYFVRSTVKFNQYG